MIFKVKKKKFFVFPIIFEDLCFYHTNMEQNKNEKMSGRLQKRNQITRKKNF